MSLIFKKTLGRGFINRVDSDGERLTNIFNAWSSSGDGKINK